MFEGISLDLFVFYLKGFKQRIFCPVQAENVYVVDLQRTLTTVVHSRCNPSLISVIKIGCNVLRLTPTDYKKCKTKIRKKNVKKREYAIPNDKML